MKHLIRLVCEIYSVTKIFFRISAISFSRLHVLICKTYVLKIEFGYGILFFILQKNCYLEFYVKADHVFDINFICLLSSDLAESLY